MNGFLERLTHDDGDGAVVTLISGDHESSRSHVVFVPGLLDGLLSCWPYVGPALQARLPPATSLVQCSLRSSGAAFGSYEVADDARDMALVVRHLVHRHRSRSIILMGHSTGCQDCIRFLRDHYCDFANVIRGVVFQAPVSDRLYIENLVPGAEKHIALALDMVDAGRAREFMPRATLFDCAITAGRFASMTNRLTDDDPFSDDLTDSELVVGLGHIAIPSLWAFSMADEYVPERVVDQRRLSERIARLVPDSRAVLLDGANHDLSSSPDHARQFVDSLVEFIARHQ